MTQPPGYTPPGGYGQNPQQPNYGQQPPQQPPTPPGYAPQPGYPGGQPPKSKKGLWIGLGIGGVVVLGLIIGLVVWLLMPASASSPEEAAEKYLEAAADHNESDIKDLSCKADEEKQDGDMFDGEKADVEEIKAKDKEKLESSKYDEAYTVKVHVKGTYKVNDDKQEIDDDIPVPVVKEDGDWKVCAAASTSSY